MVTRASKTRSCPSRQANQNSEMPETPKTGQHDSTEILLDPVKTQFRDARIRKGWTNMLMFPSPKDYSAQGR